MSRRRSFGTVRRTAGGWQARITDKAGKQVSIGMYPTKKDADRAIADARSDLARGRWVDPSSGRIRFRDYASEWLDTRPTPLRPRTRELYEGLIANHLNPSLGSSCIADLSPSAIRRWHSGMQQAGKGAPVTARSYRLLRAILNTALEDMLIAMNPCNLKGAGLDHTPERPVATIDEVFQLADAVPRRYRALVLLATFTTLREAELFALRRDRVDLAAGTVEVAEQVHTLRDGSHITGEPKTKAGRRIVAIPEAILPIVRDHLDRFAEQGRNGRLFVGEKGAPLRRNHWGTAWRKARASVGMEGFRFHDLRHTGNTLAAASGASTKELMARMGHASPRAALIYQHATRERDDVIARALSEAILRDRQDPSADDPD